LVIAEKKNQKKEKNLRASYNQGGGEGETPGGNGDRQRKGYILGLGLPLTCQWRPMLGGNRCIRKGLICHCGNEAGVPRFREGKPDGRKFSNGDSSNFKKKCKAVQSPKIGVGGARREKKEIQPFVWTIQSRRGGKHPVAVSEGENGHLKRQRGGEKLL